MDESRRLGVADVGCVRSSQCVTVGRFIFTHIDIQHTPCPSYYEIEGCKLCGHETTTDVCTGLQRYWYSCRKNDQHS